ncbi:MAG: SUMF1/EgtB/PvdO family nonheme iron enzyme, partial [Victivallaceae bacterium]
ALPPEISAVSSELENVRENFVLISKLVHQNIAGLLHLHKVVEADPSAEKLLRISPQSYLVIMEYIPGSILSSWKKQFKQRKVPWEKTIAICAKVADALDFAHEKNIIHRDIKPSNIMVTPDDKVKVMDFGLAAEMRSSMSRISQEKFDSSGTRPYMAPEQLTGKKQSAATDQYALAVMFYELISGEVPFQSVFETRDSMLMMNVVEQKAPEPLDELSKKQNAVLMRALSKNPEERFASCGAFMRAISSAKGKRFRRSDKLRFPGKPLKFSAFKKVFNFFAIAVLFFGLGVGIWYGWKKYDKSVKNSTDAENIARIRKFSDALNMANNYYKQKQYDKAISALGLVLKLDKNNKEARILQEEIYRAAGNAALIRQEAEKACQKVLALANELYNTGRSLNKNDRLAFEKNLRAIKELDDFSNSNRYSYISDSSKLCMSDLKKQMEDYMKTLTPPVPPDLKAVNAARKIPLATLAYGSNKAISLQKEWGSKLALPLEAETKETGIRLCLIPPGTFFMGSPTNEIRRDSDETRHEVTIADPFYCGKFEITQEQWEKVMGGNPSSNKGKRKPVENVSLNDCREFVKKLCILEKVSPGTYKVINEEQWEYACRAGTNSSSYLKAGVNFKNANINWSYQDEMLKKEKMTAECGKYIPNAFGLFDMYGNVYEICDSPFISYAEKNNDKTLKKNEDFYVIRGGSFYNGIKMCRSAYRSRLKLNEKDEETGFRIIRTIQR